ncbi:MAG: ATP:cob(I)alamin adenosyltransferase [Ruminococcaceae bacterium]|nr:ATP:cob(I)alamin adenosyltransferase [Oscillospiraceae bacterium]
MKLYTGMGDGGESNLVCKKCVSKCDAVFDLLGDLDESSAALCAAATFITDGMVECDIAFLQEILIEMGGVAAGATVSLPADVVHRLEEKIDVYQAKAGGFEGFVTCYKTRGAAMVNLARAVVRRAERSAVGCCYGGKSLQITLNRMSDLLFAMSTYLEKSGV